MTTGEMLLGNGSNSNSSSPLEHNPILVHVAVVREATHRCDPLLGQVVLSGGIVRFFCHVPIQATFRNPRCDLRTNRVTPQRVTTPCTPFPLVTPMQSTISFCEKQSAIFTPCSNKPRTKSTFSATVPPFTWISLMWAFFCPILTLVICVWQIARTTWQYFLIRSSSAFMGSPSDLLASLHLF